MYFDKGLNEMSLIVFSFMNREQFTQTYSLSKERGKLNIYGKIKLLYNPINENLLS